MGKGPSRVKRCETMSTRGRCWEPAIRLLSYDGARVWVCGECFDRVEIEGAQVMVRDQVTGIWVSKEAA
jgi:hypothetical protein